MTTRIMCVDDHAFLVEGLRARIDRETDLEFAGHVTSTRALLERVADDAPDIVVLDIEIPGSDAFDALAEMKRLYPDVRVVLLSAYVRDRYIDAAYAGGAWGYLSKADPPSSVIEGLRSVSRGVPAFSPAVVDRTRRSQDAPKRDDAPASRLSTLTPREEQVLRLIARGRTRIEIAETLCRSPMTIDNHRKAIMRKLGINDRGELVRFAIGEGLVEV